MPTIKGDFFFGSADRTPPPPPPQPPRPLNTYFNSLTAQEGDEVEVLTGSFTGRKGVVYRLRKRGPLPVVVEFRDGCFISYEYSQLAWWRYG